MRPGEHTVTKDNTPFKLKDIQFHVGVAHYIATDIPLDLLPVASFVTYTYNTQKMHNITKLLVWDKAEVVAVARWLLQLNKSFTFMKPMLPQAPNDIPPPQWYVQNRYIQQHYSNSAVFPSTFFSPPWASPPWTSVLALCVQQALWLSYMGSR
jgi:hypothetical protein